MSRVSDLSRFTFVKSSNGNNGYTFRIGNKISKKELNYRIHVLIVKEKDRKICFVEFLLYMFIYVNKNSYSTVLPFFHLN